jgi:hypothetical protein
MTRAKVLPSEETSCCWLSSISWEINSSWNSVNEGALSLEVIEKIVTKALEDGLRPLMMLEMRSSSSMRLPMAASWLDQDWAFFRCSEQVLEPYFRVWSWHFKWETWDRVEEANFVAKEVQTCWEVWSPQIVERTDSLRWTLIQLRTYWSFFCQIE